MEKLNERIRFVRSETGLSQRAFGARIGISGSSVNKLESGENNPSEQTIRLIVKEFGVSPVWINTGNGSVRRNINDELIAKMKTELARENETAKALFAAFLDLEQDEWRVLGKILRKLQDS